MGSTKIQESFVGKVLERFAEMYVCSLGHQKPIVWSEIIVDWIIILPTIWLQYVCTYLLKVSFESFRDLFSEVFKYKKIGTCKMSIIIFFIHIFKLIANKGWFNCDSPRIMIYVTNLLKNVAYLTHFSQLFSVRSFNYISQWKV